MLFTEKYTELANQKNKLEEEDEELEENDLKK